MSIVIKAENISKAYQIGEFTTGAITQDLHRWWEKIRGREDPYLKVGEENDRTQKGTSSMVWSLKNIDFSVEQGEAVGIIGRNGAGKSTLLKILSRVTTPTTGNIKIKGRIASLLEVGTGFHPELTGKENIFLNGAILGMKKKEIKSNFDAIVDFSGVERYIDTPVKRYSSGMYVRLAFAVAAHLDSEILIVDEVLAVGDGEFQKKCLGKMNDVSKREGRTVFLVSHNMGAISQLCQKTMMLKNGEILFNGNTENAIDFYLNSTSNNAKKIEASELTGINQFSLIYTADEKYLEKYEYKYDEAIFLMVELNVPNYNDSLELAISLYDKHKRRIFTIHEPLKKYHLGTAKMKFEIKIPGMFLTPGTYSWLMCINYPGLQLFDVQDDVCGFSIVETGSEFSRYENHDYGCVNANYQIKSLN